MLPGSVVGTVVDKLSAALFVEQVVEMELSYIAVDMPVALVVA